MRIALNGCVDIHMGYGRGVMEVQWGQVPEPILNPPLLKITTFFFIVVMIIVAR